jgi:dipeptidyl aminopeptidase/acylaminoacyl peptidase
MPPRKNVARRPASRPKSKRLITPEDLLRFHLVSDPQISPDGKSILFTKKHIGDKNSYVSNIWVVSCDGGDPRQFTSGGKDGAARWSPDGTRIAFSSGREKPKAQIFIIGASGGEAVALTKFPEGSIGEYQWSPDGTMLAVSFRETEAQWTEAAKKSREESGASTPPHVIDDVYYRLDGDGYFNTARYKLYVVDATTGDHRKVFDKDPLGWFSFSWSPDSKELAIAANTDKNPLAKPWKSRIYRLNIKSSRLTLVPNQADGTRSNVAWSPDGRKIAYAGREGRTPDWGCFNDHLFVIDARTGVTKNLTGHTDYCIAAATLSDTRDAGFGANLRWNPDGSRVFFTLGWHGECHIASVPATGGKLDIHTTGPVEHAMGNFSRNGHLALCVGSCHEPNEIAIGTMRRSSLEVEKLTEFNHKLLSELELSRPHSVWLTAVDGWKLQCWVLKPTRMPAGRKAPAILEVHGGPHAQYGVPFFHEFQVLAAQGYVVFYGNPRGSKGYGEEHCNAIKGDWGNKDWLDVQAIMSYMQKQPYVDAKRMGIMGGSYGGYMTNWAIGHTTVFAGAITDRCVSNLVSMAGSSDFPNLPDTYWKGNSWSKPETLWDQSPLKYLGNAKTPTLVIHSEGDLRCNVEQGEQVFTTLKVLGVPTRFVRYPQSTSHGMSRSGPPDLRLHRLHQIIDWWQTYLKRGGRAI